MLQNALDVIILASPDPPSFAIDDCEGERDASVTWEEDHKTASRGIIYFLVRFNGRKGFFRFSLQPVDADRIIYDSRKPKIENHRVHRKK